jgi:hemolysin activation/secretion protein
VLKINTNVNKKFTFQSLLVAVLPCTLMGSVCAQSVPDAGKIQRQVESEINGKKMTPLAPQKATKPNDPIPEVQDTEMVVSAFRFLGNTLVDAKRIDAALAKYTNTPISFDKLQAAVLAVVAAYNEDGWVATAFLPEQEVTEGTVTIQIVEAVFGGVSVEGTLPTRIKSDRLVERIKLSQAVGQPLSSEKIDRALLLINDLSGVIVKGNLQKGKNERETELILAADDGPFIVGSINNSNSGSKATGPEDWTATIAINSPLGLGDSLTTTLMQSPGVRYNSLSYAIPVGHNGGRLTLSGSNTGYKLIGADYDSLASSGETNAASVAWTFPIVRTQERNLYFNWGFADKTLNNQALAATTSQYEIYESTIGFNGNFSDNFLLGGANSATLTATFGNINLGGYNSSEDATLEGSFSKLYYLFSRQTPITANATANLEISGQVSQNILDSSEKTSMGGSSAIRAFPAGEGSADKGTVIKFELKNRFSAASTLAVFREWGRATVLLSGAQYTFQSIGAYWSGQPFPELPNFSLIATLSSRMGENQNATSAGKDQDGSLVLDRYWLSGTLAF